MRLIVIEGVTASGKSDIAVKLALALNTEIISADSMQVYRGMDIGTGKIKKEEMKGVPHYMLDVADPKVPYDLSDYLPEAKKAIEKISDQGKIPIVCGGTWFYIQALEKDLDFTDESTDEEIRGKLMEKSVDELYEMLLDRDPESTKTIHKNNKKRVVRALEYYEITGEPISARNKEEKEKPPAYDLAKFIISSDREIIYDRVEKRVDKMIEEGLLDEVRKLYDSGVTEDMRSMQGLGYKEFFPYFRGEKTLEECLYVLKRDTRHFAKRQLTYYRSEKNVEIINNNDGDIDACVKEILDKLENKFEWI